MAKPNPRSLDMDNLISHLRKRITEITDDYVQNPECASYAQTLSETLSDVVRLHSLNSSSVLPGLSGDLEFDAMEAPIQHVSIPIVGYEVMEERARFTVYKLKIENKLNGDCWFVFRRYTDFARLHSKLKTDFPKYNLNLPRKRWFGDNFDERFIEERASGLQKFIDDIVCDQQLIMYPPVRDFFCLDEPPLNENGDESKQAVFEALDEIIFNFNKVILEKDQKIETQKHTIHNLQRKSLEWALNVCDKTKTCKNCSQEVFQSLSELQQIISSKEFLPFQSDKSVTSPTSSFSSN
ncbi:sorting nexin 16 [Lycorma delicatula]|uniref:sorting nexin 16 n=1 Tax=Lycorma delicatula TaxID=130591 RepID=UPI003F510132